MSTNPDHYRTSSLEVIEIIEAFQLDFCLGNAVKYILRDGKKPGASDDLRKARWYITRAIQHKDDEMPPQDELDDAVEGERDNFLRVVEGIRALPKDHDPADPTYEAIITAFRAGYMQAYKDLGLRFE